MTITISDGTTTLTLNPDLFWSDEDQYSPVQQTAQRTITGALIVSVEALSGGRPITLEHADNAWTLRSDMEQLRNWATAPGQTLTLTLRGTARTVMFRHQDGVAVEAAPVVQYRDWLDTDWFLVTLRLMEI